MFLRENISKGKRVRAHTDKVLSVTLSKCNVKVTGGNEKEELGLDSSLRSRL